MVVDWPDRYLQREAKAGNLDSRTAVCVLTHDPKFDVPVLSLALRHPRLGYVGAMGSRKTHLERLERLRTAGLTDTELSRLSIGRPRSGSPDTEETAVSIAAEIIAARSGAQVPGSGISTANPSTRQVASPWCEARVGIVIPEQARRATAHAARNAAHLSPRSHRFPQPPRQKAEGPLTACARDAMRSRAGVAEARAGWG